MNKNAKGLLIWIITAGVAPFLIVVFKTFQKGTQEPATIGDLLAIFGIQTVLWIVLAIKVIFFTHAIAVLG